MRSGAHISRGKQLNHCKPPPSGEVDSVYYSVYSKFGKNRTMEKNLYVWTLAIFAAFGGFMFGYDTG